MKYLLLILICLNQSTYAQHEMTQDVTTRPSLSLRCKELHSEREAKIKVQQKLNALIKRNQLLVKKSPNATETVHARLKATAVKLDHQLYIANLQLEKMEENIIRSGCPGISI